MSLSITSSPHTSLAAAAPAQTGLPTAAQTVLQAKATGPSDKEARATFDQFVGEAFYGQLLSAMRKTQDKPAYFHGGRAEEMFQAQLDQTISQDLAKTNAGNLTEGMYQLFRLTRS